MDKVKTKNKATMVIAEVGARSPWSGVEEIIYRCSKCKARLHLPNENYPAASYCPNCGVLLDASGESENGWKEWTGKDDYKEQLKALKKEVMPNEAREYISWPYGRAGELGAG